MTASKLPPERLPGWPALMDEQLAAAFVSLSPGQLRAGVQRGEFPKPLRIGRRVLYHRDAMSRAINARAGIQDHHAEIEETGWEL